MNNIKIGDYVELIDNSGIDAELETVYKVTSVIRNLLQVSPTINGSNLLYVSRFNKLITKPITEAKINDTILCNDPWYFSMERFRMKTFKYKGRRSSVIILVDNIGPCDDDQFILLENYPYNISKLRKCSIDISNTTLKNRLKLKRLLESLGEEIFSETNVFTEDMTHTSFQLSPLYTGGVWNGFSGLDSNILLSNFLQTFSQKTRQPKQKKSRNKGTTNDTR